MKKIAFISEHASPLAVLGGIDSGGQNVYVSELARQMVSLGYKVDIYTRWDNNKLPKVIQWSAYIRIIHVKAGPLTFIPKEEMLGYMKEFGKDMLSFIRKEKVVYSVIHANFFMSAMVADYLKEKLGIPFVVTFHALGYVRQIYQKDKDKFPKERVIIEERIMKRADHIIAECPQDMQDMVNYYTASPHKITIIPCGFNTKEFYPVNKQLARNLLKLDADDRILLQLGRLVPRKGIDNVIRALGKLRSCNQNIKLIIVGGASEKSDFQTRHEIKRLEQIAKKEGVQNAVIFAGRQCREQLKYYYSASDIFITTPWYEPFGITPLEAMACGIPVIGSNVGGIKYSVVDGQTGCLVPPNDPEQLAWKIRNLFSNPILMMKMRNRALIRVNSFFTWNKVALSVYNLYEDICMRYHPAPKIKVAGLQ